MTVDWQYLLIASFGVTGIIQWAKALFKDPTNPWSYISPFLCFGGAVLINGGWQNMVLNTVLVLSISQLGYDVLVKPVKRILGVPENPPIAGEVSAKSFNATGNSTQNGNGPVS